MEGSITVEDKVPEKTSASLIDNSRPKSQSNNGRLSNDITLKKAARILLTVNND